MSDVLDVESWNNCLLVFSSILDKVESVEEAKQKLEQLNATVDKRKLEKLRSELGVYGLF